jgi:hypothetical protein
VKEREGVNGRQREEREKGRESKRKTGEREKYRERGRERYIFESGKSG